MNKDVKMYTRQIVKNKNYVRIVKCCLSCMHMYYERADVRACRVGCGRVNGAGYCAAYRMKEKLEKLGRDNPGGIHTRHYLMWVLDKRSEEKRLKVKAAPLDVLIAEYETQYGSRWLCKP